ncbi:hypothetical protein HOLleu_32776 [Holothuria leucospilota]|uniref:Uncharacterized protein n=1 Tax=Holothuria leucospilota TaxID=206669 RepID=A0A9Q1BJ64_HOLLE|nr:hypothetical protein HOLleu_32776 [Holothuria leucospilota]
MPLQRLPALKVNFKITSLQEGTLFIKGQNSTSANKNNGATFDQFDTRLYNLANHCDYGTLKEELIRDRIAVGICDQKLQLISELTLEKAKTTVRLNERVQKEHESMTREDITENPVAIEKVYQKSSKGPKPEGKNFRCGSSAHPKKVCPAKDSTCRKCALVGH